MQEEIFLIWVIWTEETNLPIRKQDTVYYIAILIIFVLLFFILVQFFPLLKKLTMWYSRWLNSGNENIQCGLSSTHTATCLANLTGIDQPCRGETKNKIPSPTIWYTFWERMPIFKVELKPPNWLFLRLLFTQILSFPFLIQHDYNCYQENFRKPNRCECDRVCYWVSCVSHISY